MKKTNKWLNNSIVKVMILFVALTFTSSNADAQGFLGKLKDKAAKAVQGGLDKKVDDAVGNLFGKKKKKDDSSSKEEENASEEETTEVAEGYAERLVAGDGSMSDFKPEGAKPSAELTCFADAVKAMPAMAKTEELTDEGKRKAVADKWSGYVAALSLMNAKNTEKMIGISKQLSTQSAGSIGNNGAPSADAMAMVEYMSKLSPAEQKKLEEMGEGDPAKFLEYLKTNHPKLYNSMNKQMANARTKAGAYTDADEDRINQYTDLIERISKYSEGGINDLAANANRMAQALQNGGDFSMNSNSLEGQLSMLREQIKKDWLASSECKQINEMEKNLWIRQNAWEKENSKMDKFTEYAPFFSEERAKQNVVVDAFNKRIAERWMEVIAKYAEGKKTEAMDIVDCNTKMNALAAKRPENSVAERVLYYNYLNSENIAYGFILSEYLLAGSYAFGVPFIGHVDLLPPPVQ